MSGLRKVSLDGEKSQIRRFRVGIECGNMAELHLTGAQVGAQQANAKQIAQCLQLPNDDHSPSGLHQYGDSIFRETIYVNLFNHALQCDKVDTSPGHQLQGDC